MEPNEYTLNLTWKWWKQNQFELFLFYWFTGAENDYFRRFGQSATDTNIVSESNYW